MIQAGIVIVVILILAGLAIRERRLSRIPTVEEELSRPAVSFAPAENAARWHDDSGGRQECVIDAAALAEQRKSGRHLGEDVIVDWKPGQDWEIDNHGVWIEERGAVSGIFVRRIGNARPLASPTKQ